MVVVGMTGYRPQAAKRALTCLPKGCEASGETECSLPVLAPLQQGPQAPVSLLSSTHEQGLPTNTQSSAVPVP